MATSGTRPEMSGTGDDRPASRVEMTAALRTAIQQVGPGWAAQPSRLRLGLHEVLGADAPAFRTQVHQLVVAAEERIPSRLANAPSEGAPLQELSNDLASVRGWTTEAATWAVTTWAAALGVDEAKALDGAVPSRPGPTVSPGHTPTVLPGPAATVLPEGPSDHRSPSAAPAALPTVLPSDAAPGQSTGPTVLPEHAIRPPGDGVHRESALGGAPAGASAEPVTLDQLSRAGTKLPTRRASALLGHQVDIAFAVRTGPGPLAGVPILAVGVLALLFGGPLGTLIWCACAIALLVLACLSPYRVLALSGEQAWLMTTRQPFSTKPTAVVHHGWRSELRPAGGWLLPVMTFGGQRLRFFIPNTGAARRLARGVPAAATMLPIPQGGDPS